MNWSWPNPCKPYRRSDDERLRVVRMLLAHQPDVLLMHDGSDAPYHAFRGSPLVREVIEQPRYRTLVGRGHALWREPLVELTLDRQVLNDEAR